MAQWPLELRSKDCHSESCTCAGFIQATWRCAVRGRSGDQMGVGRNLKSAAINGTHWGHSQSTGSSSRNFQATLERVIFLSEAIFALGPMMQECSAAHKESSAALQQGYLQQCCAPICAHSPEICLLQPRSVQQIHIKFNTPIVK